MKCYLSRLDSVRTHVASETEIACFSAAIGGMGKG
jgi:hypothetical protein